ncbi:MAG: ABC transporter substrate-binding protein, partial [Pseudomonas sp.]|nr:ABC transporter substrate-binding protein [Pseudomonas sp.]
MASNCTRQTPQALRMLKRCLAVWSLLLLCLLSPAAPADNAPLQVIDFQLRWKHQFQFAGYYAAIAQGYYREEGLDVRLHQGAPGKTPVEEVLAGRAQ